MLSFPGVSADRAERLRGMADAGHAVTIERPLGAEGHVCLIDFRGRRVEGQGQTADAAAADALARWDDEA